MPCYGGRTDCCERAGGWGWPLALLAARLCVVQRLLAHWWARLGPGIADCIAWGAEASAYMSLSFSYYFLINKAVYAQRSLENTKS